MPPMAAAAADDVDGIPFAQGLFGDKAHTLKLRGRGPGIGRKRFSELRACHRKQIAGPVDLRLNLETNRPDIAGNRSGGDVH